MSNQLPSWSAVCGLVAIIVARVGNSALVFNMSVRWPVYVLQGLMMAALSAFWSFSAENASRDRSKVSTAVRLAGLFFCAYAVVMSIDWALHGGADSLWFGCSFLVIQNFLLVYPLASLFGRLRHEPALPVSLVLAHAAVFFFWALMMPAVIQSVRVDAPRYLLWIQVGVPVLTAAMLSVHLSNRAALKRHWFRELGLLFLKNWHLPILFFLGEVGVMFVGAYSGG